MMAMFDANRERLAERFMLCGLVCSYAIGESKEIAQDAPLFLLNAHNILHNAINPNRRYPLLNRLADIAIQDAQYEQFREKVLETNRDPGDTYILKIELKECKPAVWRRLEISSKASLLEFHAVLQCAMGWEATIRLNSEQTMRFFRRWITKMPIQIPNWRLCPWINCSKKLGMKWSIAMTSGTTGNTESLWKKFAGKSA